MSNNFDRCWLKEGGVDIRDFRPAAWYAFFTKDRIYAASYSHNSPTDHLLKMGFIVKENNRWVVTQKYRDYMYKNG